MVTSVDTNILLDIFLPDPVYGERSLKLLEASYLKGALVICGEVYAELAPQFEDKTLLDSTLVKMGIEVVQGNNNTYYLAGRTWLAYRKNSKTRDRIITDFIIGAFAINQANGFLTRDRGFYRKYFRDLNIPGQ